MRDAHDLLRDALVEAAGPDAAVLDGTSAPWASVTFTGCRHRLRLAVAAGDAARLAAALPEAEFALRGHLVADLTVAGRRDEGARATLAIEALTIEAR